MDMADLERRYDGPIPAPLRQVARLGSVEAVELLYAEHQAAFYRDMVLGQIAIIRRRRAAGSWYPSLHDDLRFYRAGWHRWLARRTAARRAVA